MKIGYDINLTKEKSEEFKAAGSVKDFSPLKISNSDIQHFNEFILENKEHEILLHSLKSIGSFTFIQLGKTFSIIEEHQITVTFLNTNIGNLEIKQNFLETLKEIIAHEEFAILKRTRIGLELARSEGRIGGRPKISDEKVKKIHYLYYSKHKPLREIAEELDISLGTVHKYTKINPS